MASGNILDFSLNAYKLRVRDRRLQVQYDGKLQKEISIDDIAVVILSNPRITITAHALQELIEAEAVVVYCNKQSIPIGMTLPLFAHHEGGERMRTQIDAMGNLPMKKRLWKQIVKEKIKNQARLLLNLFQDDAGLMALYQGVKSDDSDNREGVAAKKYWAKLFEGRRFKRDYDGNDPINAALNYGYAILRAIVARSIAAAGLIPGLGVGHINTYNGYALADDIMEPFRPVVDYAVYGLLTKDDLQNELTPETKARIIVHITSRYLVNGFQEAIFETTTKAVESLVRVFEGRSNEIVFPTQMPFEPIYNYQVPIFSPTPNDDKENDGKQGKRSKQKPPF